MSAEEDRLSANKILQGSVLILISNVIYIGNNYLVAWTGLTASEIALVRGGFQVIVFGIIVWRGQRTNETGIFFVEFIKLIEAEISNLIFFGLGETPRRWLR